MKRFFKKGNRNKGNFVRRQSEEKKSHKIGKERPDLQSSKAK